MLNRSGCEVRRGCKVRFPPIARENADTQNVIVLSLRKNGEEESRFLNLGRLRSSRCVDSACADCPDFLVPGSVGGSEKSQNERSPNFSNFLPEFSPNCLRSFRASFRGETETRKK